MEMHSKIKELTEKIHREGLEKANEEAEKILRETRAEAEKIISDAKKEAEKIRNDARKEAEDFSEKTKSEVRMSQQQALAAFKKDITELIQAEVVKEPVKSSMDDKEFVQKLIETVVKNWKNDSEDVDLQVLLPKDQVESAEKYLRKKASDLMKNGLVVKEYPGISRGFEIQPENGHFKISMTDEAFEEFIREHFKPKTVEFLFGGDK